MRIGIDATPAAVQRGGVGRYTRELLRALVARPSDHRFILTTAAPGEQATAMLEDLPPGSWRELRRLPLRERWMTLAWQRLRTPLAVERLIGPHDLFHGPDFALPPGRAPKVVTVHDLSFLLNPDFAEPSLARYLKSVLPRSLQRADAVITVSTSVAAELAELFPEARGKLVAIPNGVRVPAGLPVRSETDPPAILLVGTIEPRKNHFAALEAIRIVRREVPNARLVLLGRPGWRSDDIQCAIRESMSREEAIWLPDADDDALERSFAEASVLIAPSHYEGFGLPLLEAMARGVPVVASDIAAHREVAGDAVLYAPLTDPEALAEQVLRLLRDGELRAVLGDTGRQRASYFSWQETARRTLRVYESVAGGSTS